MTPIQVIFWIASAIILLGAMAMVTRRNLVHAALYLVVTLFGVAVFYVLLEASFLAVVQILVYIGAIAILMIFAVMLTRQVTNTGKLMNANFGLAMVIAVVVFVGVYMALSTWPAFGSLASEIDTTATVSQLGTAFFVGDDGSPSYLLATLSASVLLLVPLVGAIYIARQRD